MSFIVGSVTLPKAPLRITCSTGAVKRSDFSCDGAVDIVVSTGKSVKTLTVQGIFYSAGVSKATLETTYIAVLEALKGTEVLLAFPDTRYNGYWALVNFTYEEAADDYCATMFTYTLEFVQGSDFLGL